MKAKTLSKIGKIVAVVYIIAMSFMAAAFNWQIESGVILKTGLTLVAITGPIDISIWLDKLKR